MRDGELVAPVLGARLVLARLDKCVFVGRTVLLALDNSHLNVDPELGTVAVLGRQAIRSKEGARGI
jgi:hypothetical protein